MQRGKLTAPASANESVTESASASASGSGSVLTLQLWQAEWSRDLWPDLPYRVIRSDC